MLFRSEKKTICNACVQNLGLKFPMYNTYGINLWRQCEINTEILAEHISQNYHAYQDNFPHFGIRGFFTRQAVSFGMIIYYNMLARQFCVAFHTGVMMDDQEHVYPESI